MRSSGSNTSWLEEFNGPTIQKMSTSLVCGLGIISEIVSDTNICISGTVMMKRCRVTAGRPLSDVSFYFKFWVRSSAFVFV